MNLETIKQFFDSTCSANTFSIVMEVLFQLFVANAVGSRNHLLEVACDVDFSQVNKFCTEDPFDFSSGAIFVLTWEHPTPPCGESEFISSQCPNFGL